MSRNWTCIHSVRAVQLFRALENDDFQGMMAALGEYQAHPDLRVVHPQPERRLADRPFVIHVAAFFNAMSCFRYLVHNCTLDVRDDRGRELCQFAAYSGSVTIFDLMLENEVSIDALGVNYMRPFLIAAKYGHTDLCKWLFVNGCQSQCFNKSEENALDLAAAGCHIETYKFLLRIGLSHNNPNVGNGNPWYNGIVKTGNEEFLRMLLESEVPHFPDSTGAWPIHYAARVGRTDILQEFCESGVDVNATDNQGDTPLMSAVRTGNMESVSILMNAKANVNAESSAGQTALMAAVLTGVYDIISKLIDAGADVNAHNKKGATPLMMAMKKRAFDSAKLLLDTGAEVDAVDRNGRTAFHYAAKHGFIEGGQILLKYGADMFITDVSGMGAEGFAEKKLNKKFSKWLAKVERQMYSRDNDRARDDHDSSTD